MIRLTFPFLVTLFLLPSAARADEDIFKLGLEALKNRKFHVAIACFHDVIQRDPKNAEAYYYRGLAYDGKGDHEKAAKDFSEAARLNPKHPLGFADKTVSGYISWGLDSKNKRDYENAIKAFDEAIRLNPMDPETFNNRGVAFAGKRAYDRAIKDFTEALRLKPTSSSALTNRGYAYLCKGDNENAAKDFEKAMRLNPLRRFQLPPLDFWDRAAGNGWILSGHLTIMPPLHLQFHLDLGGSSE
jgi:tetratricopeptide (TPR) repeat protein